MDGRNFQGTPYVSQYAGLPMDAFLRSAGKLQDSYEKNVAQMDQYDILAANTQTLDADSGVKNALIEAARNAHAEIAKTGDYEHAAGQVNLLTKRFTANPDLTAAQNNLKRYQTLSEEFKKDGVGPHQLQYLQAATRDYKGIGTPDANGNYSQFGAGLSSYKDQNIAERVDKLLNGWKADKKVTETSDGKWLNKDTNEIIDTNELRLFATQSLLTDPTVKRQLIDEARYRTGDVTLGGEKLSKAMMKQIEGYVEPVAQKYGYTSTEKTKDVDPYGMNAVTNAQDNARQARGFAHAEKMQARSFAHDDAKAKEGEFRGNYAGNIMSVNGNLPTSGAQLTTKLADSDKSIASIKAQLANPGITPSTRENLYQQLNSVNQEKAMLASIRQDYFAKTYTSPREAKIMGILEASRVSTPEKIMNGTRGSYLAPASNVISKSEAIKNLKAQGITLTDAQYKDYVEKGKKAAGGFDKYLEQKRSIATERPAMYAVNEKDGKAYSEQLQAMGNYQVHDESGNNLDHVGRKFTVTGHSAGAVGGKGYVYDAILEPTAEEKKKNPEAIGKRVTIVPGVGDTNYKEFASRRKDEVGNYMLNDKFSNEISSVIHTPYDNVQVPINYPHTDANGVTQNVDLGKIKRLNTSKDGSGIPEFEYTPPGLPAQRYSSEGELKTALQSVYGQLTDK